MSRNALACGLGVRELLSGSGPHASALKLKILVVKLIVNEHFNPISPSNHHE